MPDSPETHSLKEIASIADMFAIEGDFISSEEIQSGLINCTYKVTYRNAEGESHQYILQKVNTNVFRNPKGVMQNVERVTRHINWKVLRRRKDSSGQTLNLFPARGGKFYAHHEDSYWRCYNFIEGTHTYDVVETSRQAYQVARAFASFQDLVSDMPLENIVETIPDFHHTRKRYDRLMEAAREDALGRLSQCRAEFEFIQARESDVDHLLALQEEGILPTRITHNDTKINNVMLDSQTDEAVCVIDLDTVMPGLSLYDFGDMVRTATSPAFEDEQDISKVTMRMHIFEALVQGYLEGGINFLTDAEINELAFSGKLLALEVAIRFLTDHLEGDHYFKTTREGHNLDRTRTQLALVRSIEEQYDTMCKIVERTAKACRS